MPEPISLPDFVAALRRCELPEVPGWEAVAATAADPATLAHALVRADGLTQFQARQLLRGRGDELVLGPFLILDRLGSGGMGQVFRAKHRLMGRVVALKLIRPELIANPSALARFQQEVQAAARLTHPNVVHALHAERTGRGFFLAMEFCDGRDLAKVVGEAGPLCVRLACDYAAQAAAGLAAAHAAGLVHRDVKPGNLLLTTAGVVKILDFGLARLHAGTDGKRLTRHGSVMGTPDFVAPEQVRDSASADGRADVYSLGCTLYFLLAGRVPYPGGSDWEKVLRHVSGTPVPVEVVRPGVPPALAAVVRRMMAREPAERFPAAEVEAALAPFRGQDDAPVNPGSFAGHTPPAPPIAPPHSARAHGSTVAHVPPPTRATVAADAPGSDRPAPEGAAGEFDPETPSGSPGFAAGESAFTDGPPAPEAARTFDAPQNPLTPTEPGPAFRPGPLRSRGVWLGVAAGLVAVGAAALLAWPDSDNRSRAEQEKTRPNTVPLPVSLSV